MCECLHRSIRHVAGNADTRANEKPPAFVPETLSALNGNLAVTAETA